MSGFQRTKRVLSPMSQPLFSLQVPRPSSCVTGWGYCSILGTPQEFMCRDAAQTQDSRPPTVGAGRASQFVVEWPALGSQFLLQHPIWSTHPRVMGLPLPLDQLGLKQFQNLGVAGVGSQVVGLVGVLVPVIELPALPVVVLMQVLIPARGLAGCGAIQQILKGRRDVEVLVDGEGHLEVEVVHQVEVLVVHGAHGVGHGDLVVALAAEDRGPEGFCLQHWEEGPPSELDGLCAKDGIARVGDGEPIQDGGREIWKGDGISAGRALQGTRSSPLERVNPNHSGSWWAASHIKSPTGRSCYGSTHRCCITLQAMMPSI